MRGWFRAAAPLYLEVAQARPAEAAALRVRAAEMHLLAGDERDGRALLGPALRALGIPLPCSRAALVTSCAASLLRMGAARLRARARLQPVRAASHDERVEASFRVGYMLTMLSPAQGSALLLWSAARALRHGSAPQRGRALAQIAQVLSALQWPARARGDALLCEALELTQTDASARAHTLLAAALLHFARTEYPAALERLDHASAIMASAPVDTRGFGAHVHAVRASVCVASGDFVLLDSFAGEAEREAVAHGNQTAASQLRSACALRALSRGDSAPLACYAREDRRRWAGPRLTPLYGLAIWAETHRLLYLGQHAAAAQLMAVEAPRFARSGVARTQPWSVALNYLWGCVALASSQRAGDRFGRMAAAFARRLERETVACARGCSALIDAGLARRDGAPEAARARYEEAGAELTRVGMHGHAAVAAYRIAQLRAVSHPAACAPWFAAQQIARADHWARTFAP